MMLAPINRNDEMTGANNHAHGSLNSLVMRADVEVSSATGQNSNCSSNETVIACIDRSQQQLNLKPEVAKLIDHLEQGGSGEMSSSCWQPTEDFSEQHDGIENHYKHHYHHRQKKKAKKNIKANGDQETGHSDGTSHSKLLDETIADENSCDKAKPKGSNIKNLIHLVNQHLNIFGHYNGRSQMKQETPIKSSRQTSNNCIESHALKINQDHLSNAHDHDKQSPTSWTQRYLRLGRRNRSDARSAPTTPVKWSTISDKVVETKIVGVDSCVHQVNGMLIVQQLEKLSSNNTICSVQQVHCNKDDNKQHAQQQPRPSVRFDVDSTKNTGDHDNEGSLSPTDKGLNRKKGAHSINTVDKLDRQANEQAKFADCGVQTSTDKGEQHHRLTLSKGEKFDLGDEAEVECHVDENEGIKFVARLFKLPDGDNDQVGHGQGECPMNSEKFRDYGYKLIDYIRNYLDTIGERRVTPIDIEPGYLKSLIQPDAPEKGESFAAIMRDFENHIMSGITHWQHPHFHAYFPAGNAYPSILADMLSDALGCVGFSWAASPAYTELEIIMLDWMGKMIGLPDEFLCLSGGKKSGQDSKGGGVIQGSASECVLVNLLAARHWAMEKLREKHPGTPDGILLSRLIGYCSKEAHSCVEKASMIGFIRMRALETDENHSLRGATLAKAIEADIAQGLEPFIVCATLGTTSCVSFDNLEELGKVCRDNDDIWLHVDAAYAGSAFICPEFKYLMKGIEMATSFNMNPNKWMLINFDCSLMWVRDRFKLTRAFVVDPLYLQHSFSDQAIDYRHWGIPLSRRFRALKLWFVIRNYGVEGLREYIRNHCKLAKLFERLIRSDKRFMVTNEVVLGLVCFRLIGSNALNQRLLSLINASGKLHMVPASLNGRYVIRFCVCDQNAKEADIHYAFNSISQSATELFESITVGRERIRAISQQNTIDVSSISLHTQQSLSTDRLDDNSGANNREIQSLNKPTATGARNDDDSFKVQPMSGKLSHVNAGRPTSSAVWTKRDSVSFQSGRQSIIGTDGLNNLEYGIASKGTSNESASTAAIARKTPLSPVRSPLVKQVSMQQQPHQMRASLSVSGDGIVDDFINAEQESEDFTYDLTPCQGKEMTTEEE